MKESQVEYLMPSFMLKVHGLNAILSASHAGGETACSAHTIFIRPPLISRAPLGLALEGLTPK
jgi:hypothetical protein